MNFFLNIYILNNMKTLKTSFVLTRTVAVLASVLGLLLLLTVTDSYSRGEVHFLLVSIGIINGLCGIAGGTLLFFFKEEGRILLKYQYYSALLYVFYYGLINNQLISPALFLLVIFSFLFFLSRLDIIKSMIKDNVSWLDGKYIKFDWITKIFFLVFLLFFTLIWSFKWEEYLGLFNTPRGEGLPFYSENNSFPKIQVLVEGGYIYDYTDYKLIDYDFTKNLPWEIEMLDPRIGLDGEIVIAMNDPQLKVSIESSSTQTVRIRILNSLSNSFFYINGRESEFKKSPVAEYWEKEGIDNENLIASVQSSSYFFTDKGYWRDIKVEKGKKYTISTAREFSERDETTFYVMSDLHSGYSTYIPEVKKNLKDKPDFIIWNGDIVNWGYPTEYMIASSIAKSLPVGIYTTIGNHDVWNDGGKMYDKYFGPRYYSFVLKDTLYIFLDTSGSVIGTVQMDWLERLLEEAIQKNIIVFSHMSPVNTVTGLFDESNQIDEELRHTMYSKAESEYLMELMKKHNVSAFISGHSHVMGEYLIGGTSYISSGALGGSVDSGSEVGYLKCTMKEKIDCEKIIVVSKDDIAAKKFGNYLYAGKVFGIPFLINNSLRISATFIWIALLDIFLFRVIRKSWRR